MHAWNILAFVILDIQASLSDTYFSVHWNAVGEQGPYMSGVYTPKL